MNQIDFDNLIIGNHDFNYGTSKLKDWISQSNFWTRLFKKCHEKLKIISPWY